MTQKVVITRQRGTPELAKKELERQSPERKRGESICYRIMSILEQNEALRGNELIPGGIKKEYYRTGRNYILQKFLNRTHLSFEIFEAVGKGEREMDPRERADVARDLGVEEVDIWY